MSSFFGVAIIRSAISKTSGSNVVKGKSLSHKEQQLIRVLLCILDLLQNEGSIVFGVFPHFLVVVIGGITSAELFTVVRNLTTLRSGFL